MPEDRKRCHYAKKYVHSIETKVAYGRRMKSFFSYLVLYNLWFYMIEQRYLFKLYLTLKLLTNLNYYIYPLITLISETNLII